MELEMGIIPDEFCSKHPSGDDDLMNFHSDHHICVGPASGDGSGCRVSALISLAIG